jgi:hypothetical protein
MYGDGGGGCAANDRVQTRGLVLWLLPTTVGPPATFMGILPDGVSVTAKNGDGSTAEVATSGAAFVVSVTGREGGITVHTKTVGDHTTTAGHTPDFDAGQHPS